MGATLDLRQAHRLTHKGITQPSLFSICETEWVSFWETEARGSQVWSQGGLGAELKVRISKVARLHLKINKSRASNEATFYTNLDALMEGIC